jgi:hypothetical protein
MYKKYLFASLCWLSGTILLMSCGTEKPKLLSCAELGIADVQPTPQQALSALVTAVSKNDTLGAVRSVVSVQEMRALYPRQNDADTNRNSAQIIPQLFHMENMKHLKRWFQDYAGKPVAPLLFLGEGTVVVHRGFEIIGDYPLKGGLPMVRSVVHCRDGYKAWAVLDRTVATQATSP